METTDIWKLLPHRYPFLLVDRVIEIVADKRIVCIKNVTINEQVFTGHFPATPVFPGVMIVEALAQAAGILAFASRGRTLDGGVWGGGGGGMLSFGRLSPSISAVLSSSTVLPLEVVL